MYISFSAITHIIVTVKEYCLLANSKVGILLYACKTAEMLAIPK